MKTLMCSSGTDTSLLRMMQTILSRTSVKKFIHLVVSLTTCPKSLPKRAVHIVRSRASSFKWEYSLLSLKSSSCFLDLLPRLPVTFIPPFIIPSITCCRRQFLHFQNFLEIHCRYRLISCSTLLTPTSQNYIYIYIIYIQGVTGGTDQTSGGCSLC